MLKVKLLIWTGFVFGPFLQATMAFAQNPAQTPSAFEVASLRLSDPKSDQMTTWEYEHSNRFTAKKVPLKILIAIAYGTSDNRVEGLPNWADSALYDVNAKAEGEVLLTDKTVQPMLQQLLMERLQLKVHRETRQVKGYALLVGKGAIEADSRNRSDRRTLHSAEWSSGPWSLAQDAGGFAFPPVRTSCAG